MQLVDRIEHRRFVGRELLLWLWFESEIFDATLITKEHGPFGLWLERRLVLSAGKESTRVTAPSPGLGREAKEALLRGQLPESAGIRMSWRDDETNLVLKADTLGITGLKLRAAVLGKEEDAPNPLLEDLKPKGKKPRKNAAERDDEAYEAFYERMQLTQELEGLLETLYRDFLALRLSPTWKAEVVPTARAWAQGQDVDAELYKVRTGRGPQKKRAAR